MTFSLKWELTEQHNYQKMYDFMINAKKNQVNINKVEVILQEFYIPEDDIIYINKILENYPDLILKIVSNDLMLLKTWKKYFLNTANIIFIYNTSDISTYYSDLDEDIIFSYEIDLLNDISILEEDLSTFFAFNIKNYYLKLMQQELSLEQLLKLQFLLKKYNFNSNFKLPSFLLNPIDPEIQILYAKTEVSFNNLIKINNQSFQFYNIPLYINELLLNTDKTIFFPNGFITFFKDLTSFEQKSIEELLSTQPLKYNNYLWDMIFQEGENNGS